MQSEGQVNSLSNSEPKFEIDQKCMMILLSGRPLDLTVVEFRLLKQFINNPQVVFTRDDLLNKIYDDYRLVSDRTIDSHIKNVRKKLHVALPDQEVIKSVYGAGYVFLS
jgi:two-component system response regulator BaeR